MTTAMWGDLKRRMISSRKRVLEEVETADKKKQRVTEQQRRHYGLINQGATCYLNSVLQVLFMTPEIYGRLDPKSLITDQELRKIFEKLQETTCGTENITKSLEIEDVYEQEDAAKCLELILDKVSPQVSEVFQGQLAYTTKCFKGHSINEETNPFWTLPLSLRDMHDGNYSVERGFEKIFQTKFYKEDNMLFCKQCKKKTEAASGCEMVESPHILILLLKRFVFDYNIMSDVKSDCSVDVPQEIETQGKKYKLYGIVNHMGSLTGGHYTATVRSREDKTWYDCEDTHVQKAEEQPFAKARTYNSSTAYLLMYRASVSRDEVKEEQEEPCKSSANIKKNPLLILLIVLGCALIIILVVVLASLNRN